MAGMADDANRKMLKRVLRLDLAARHELKDEHDDGENENE